MHSRMTFTNATPLDDALHARRQERTTVDVLIDHRAAPSLPHHPPVDFPHPRQFLRAHRRKKERKRKREGSFSTSRRITTCTRAIPLGIPDGRPIERVFTKEKPDARTESTSEDISRGRSGKGTRGRVGRMFGRRTYDRRGFFGSSSGAGRSAPKRGWTMPRSA